MKGVSRQAVPQTASLQYLPFLYCTRTILRDRSCFYKAQNSATFRAASHLRARVDAIPQREEPAHNLTTQEKSVNFFKEKLRGQEEHVAQSRKAPRRTPKSSQEGISTITTKEQQIFKRIFDDIAAGSKPVKPKVLGEQDSQSPIDYQEIFSIFSNATLDRPAYSDVEPRLAVNERKQENFKLSEQDQEHIQKYPERLRSIASRATLLAKTESRAERSNASPQSQRQLGRSDEGQQPDFLAAETEFSTASNVQKRAIDLICAAQMKRISGVLLDAAKVNDKWLWNACETSVFPLLSFLEEDPSSSVRPSQARPSSSDDGTTSFPQEEATHHSDKAPGVPDISIRFHGGRLAPPGIKKQSFSNISSTILSNPKVEPQRPAFHIPATIPFLPIISTLYPALLLLTLRLLTTHYPLSPYPTNLLPHIRSLGLRSYVLGTSTQLYNTLLSHRWTVYSDLLSMDNLLNEMERGGVDFNTETVEILQAVRAEKLEDEIAEREAEEHTKKEDKEWAKLNKKERKKLMDKRAGLIANGIRPGGGRSAGRRGRLWWEDRVRGPWFERVVGSGGWRGKVMERLREKTAGENAVVEREYAGADAAGEDGVEGLDDLDRPKVWL